MFRRSVIALGCAASAFGLSAPAQAEHFSFSFTAPVRFYYWNDDAQQEQWYAGDTATGSGFLDADDNGDGSFAITSLTGSVYRWDGDSAQNIDFFFGGDFSDDSVMPTIDAVEGGFELRNLGIFSGGVYTFFRQDDGSFMGNSTDGGTVYGASFTLAPAASAAPEIATWGMMVLGFGALGAAMRRRSVAVTFA